MVSKRTRVMLRVDKASSLHHAFIYGSPGSPGSHGAHGSRETEDLTDEDQDRMSFYSASPPLPLSMLHVCHASTGCIRIH